jgi:transaldolase / glucose-6-phosphate isomerase
MYVEELIGPDEVNTVPTNTFEAFCDHGKARLSLDENVEGAADTMASLAKAGISMHEVTEKLVEDGVRLFSEAFDQLLSGRAKREARGSAGGGAVTTLPLGVFGNNGATRFRWLLPLLRSLRRQPVLFSLDFW